MYIVVYSCIYIFIYIYMRLCTYMYIRYRQRLNFVYRLASFYYTCQLCVNYTRRSRVVFESREGWGRG